MSPRTVVRHRRPVTGSGDARGHGGLPAAGAPPCRAVPAAGLSREALPGRPAVVSRGCQLAGASWPRAVTFAQPPAGGAALPGRPDVRPMTGTPPALSGGSAKVTPRPGRSSEPRPTLPSRIPGGPSAGVPAGCPPRSGVGGAQIYPRRVSWRECRGRAAPDHIKDCWCSRGRERSEGRRGVTALKWGVSADSGRVLR